MKTTAVVLALVPLCVIAVLGIGEGQSGWPHFMQLVLGLILLALAWQFPRWGGFALVAIALALGVAYAAFPPPALQLSTIFAVECLIYMPFIVSGVLFSLAARQKEG